ncbi:MAG: cysteine desulfurase-like protein [Caldilineaceae bacterium]|nr:cysteine desulfurase-like protein [Caldilineaceae bacterium]
MLNPREIRRQFPALQEEFNGRPAIFFDNPGGTQVHASVIEAMTDYLIRRNANVHGIFETSHRTDAVVAGAHEAMADLLGCDADEIAFGNNMTSLTFAMSRSLAREFRPRDEIVVTRLDHDANVMPWVLAAEDMGASVQWVDIDLETCTIDMDDMRQKITPRTKLVAVGYASNATGTINDVATVVKWAREVGAYSYIDAVQYAPHGLIDVRKLGCDFLACSSYKFFGPHSGQLYGKGEHLERLEAYKVRPADNRPPGKWETGTQNHEAMAGVTAAVNYLARVGVVYGKARESASRREQLISAWEAIQDYETMLIEALITGLHSIPGVRIYGLTDRSDWRKRVATVAIRKSGTTPQQLAQVLAAENIFCWNGNFYAVSVSERLGVEESGGFLRIGLAHYNTLEEIDRCLSVIDRV